MLLVTVAGRDSCALFRTENVTLLYLLPVFVSAARWGRGPTLFVSFLGVLTLDFFFVPPLYSLTVANPKDLATLAIFLLLGIVTGQWRQDCATKRKRPGKEKKGPSHSMA